MVRRLDKTLGDYLGIAISPVLIMTLVGSLIYFLLLVVYEGQYGGRLHFIFAMFVMAAVLIGRIAIEEGRERANAFAAPLAVVTLLAIHKFTDLGWIGSLLLVGLIWWCAHKLTWDCTLIDETEDASGEGLMQTIGLDEKAAQTAPPEAEPHKPETPEEPEGVTSPAAEEPGKSPASWWQRFVRRQRRPHAPGVWVVYFSLAALPLFGFGQLFIPQEDAEARGYAFLLLLVYVASGLGLLLATSFLGLRRYLRQRQIEMPASMAGLWITIGCVLIVALLFFAMLLPRPGAEWDVAKLPFRVGSSRLGSSQHAMMKSDPAEEDKGGPRVATREEDEDVPSGSEGSGDDRASPGGSASDEKGAAAGKKGEQGGSAQGSQGQEGSSSAGSEEGRGDSQSGSESQPQAGSQSQGEQGSSKSDSRAEAGRSSPDSPDSQAQQERSRSSEKGERDSRSNSEGDRRGDRSARDDRGRGAKPESRSPEDEPARRSRPDSKQAESARDGRRESETESSGRGGWREEDRGGDEAQEPDSETAEDGGTADQGEGRPWFDPTALTSNAASTFATLLKWVFYGGLLLAIGYWLWRSRADLVAAVRGFLQELRDFWQRLFGRRAGAADQAAESGEGPQTPTHRPFADYADPFASGMADRWSPDELVRYTFAALEAWAREHGWGRGPDQTPHEFAHDLGTRVHAISQDARRLADLYCRVAYAQESVPRKSVAPLKQLWQALRHREPVSV